jgi:hypothetical protein
MHPHSPVGVQHIMKNFLCTITWNTHCNKEDIEGIKKEILRIIKLKFWNTKNLELNYKPVGVENDNRKKT